MKQLTCEMCGSTELLKQDGVFVCQTCGTKYSVEEAKKMMIEGTVEVTGTVQIDRANEINNKVENAINEFDSKNFEITVTLCSDILNIDPYNYKARLYKGLADGWQTSLENNRLISASKEICRAIDIIKRESDNSNEFVKRSLSVCTNFAKLGTITIKMLTDYRDKNMAVYNDLTSKARSESGTAMIYALSNPTVSKIHSNNSKIYYNKAASINNDINRIYGNGMNSTIVAMNNLAIHIINNVGDICEVSEETLDGFIDYTNKYKNQIDNSTKSQFDSIIDFYNNSKTKLHNYNLEMKRKEQDEKNNLYWQEHSAEKQQLEAEKAELTPKADMLQAQVNEIEETTRPQINELNNQKNVPVPAREEYDKKTNEIRELENQRNSLGIFKGKEKKALQERIDALCNEKNELEKEIEPQERTRNREINEKINALKDQGKDQRMELETIRNRIAEIDRELTMDR